MRNQLEKFFRWSCECKIEPRRVHNSRTFLNPTINWQYNTQRVTKTHCVADIFAVLRFIITHNNQANACQDNKKMPSQYRSSALRHLHHLNKIPLATIRWSARHYCNVASNSGSSWAIHSLETSPSCTIKSASCWNLWRDATLFQSERYL